MTRVVPLQQVEDGPSNGFASPTMIDRSATGISVSRTYDGLVCMTCSLGYSATFKDGLYSLVFIGHCYICCLHLMPIAYIPFSWCEWGSQGFSMLEFKGADEFLNSILIHTAAVRVSSLDTSSRNDRLLNLLGFNPNPPIHAGC